MAKALLGHMDGTDPRLARDVVLLRRRVADLEALVARLQRDNDELSAALREHELMLGRQLAPESPERLLEPALH
jgi:hypothetical protein